MDELWRALRGAPGLVEHADSLTRLNRAKGMAHIMITHSLADLDALATEEDRAKARGFMDRSAITVLAGLPPRELARVNEITPLTGPERALVASWSAPESYQADARHPGRGKYLIKTGERLGIPVQLTLVGPEPELYDTDQAIRGDQRAGRPGRGATVSRALGPRPPRPLWAGPQPPGGHTRRLLGAGRPGRADLGRGQRSLRRSQAAGRSRSARNSPVMSCTGTRPGPGRIPRPWRSPSSRSSCSRAAGRRCGHGLVADRAGIVRRPGIRWQRWPATRGSAGLTRLPIARTASLAAAVSGRRGPPTCAPGRSRAGAGPADASRPECRDPRCTRSWEDTVVAFMAPRSGKTTAQAIPFVLSAPGPVIATSNKSDLWAATATLRAERDRRAGVAVRPAAHHLPAAGLVVEPAGAACAPSRTPTASPGTSSSPSPTSTAVTCGVPPPRICWPRCSWPPRRLGSPCTRWPGG